MKYFKMRIQDSEEYKGHRLRLESRDFLLISLIWSEGVCRMVLSVTHTQTDRLTFQTLLYGLDGPCIYDKIGFY